MAMSLSSGPFEQGAAKLCPSVHTVTLDGRKAEERGKAWAAADVFCSLSDNIQETFGISPIEAMAAGLPVVVSGLGWLQGYSAPRYRWVPCADDHAEGRVGAAILLCAMHSRSIPMTCISAMRVA